MAITRFPLERRLDRPDKDGRELARLFFLAKPLDLNEAKEKAMNEKRKPRPGKPKPGC
jgi:hypothetical protein